MPDASAEVEAISARRADWSTAESAGQLADDIVRRGRQLSDFPRSGRIIPEFQLQNLREVLEQGYRILYEVFPDRVEIFGVISSRQDLVRPDVN